jgi:hypothetical protein
VKTGLIRTLILAASFAGLSLLGSVSPASAAEASETITLCAVQYVGNGSMTLTCTARVGDATPGVGPDPEGTVVFFYNAISSNAAVGQCTLGTLGTPGGLSVCTTLPTITGLPVGPATIWAVYYPAAGSPYEISVDSDDVGNPPTAPPDPTDTKILCVPTGPAGVAQPLACTAIVADDDGDPGPGSPTGTVAFFLNSISSSAFLGQCPLETLLATGLTRCTVPPGGVTTPAVGPGPVTIWGVYYPDTANYQGSVDNDTVTV